MDRSLLEVSLTRGLASIAMLLLALLIFGSQAALAQVNLTKHNLASARVAAPTSLGASAEACVFCHTPYGADTSAAVPLWNRAPAAAYTTYNSLGTSSQVGATAPVGSVSIACLSCHDGVQAMNVMINAPGTGLVNAWTETGQTPGNLSGANIGLEVRSDHPFGIQYGGGALAQDGPPVAPGLYRNTLMRDRDFSSAQMILLNEQAVWWVDTAGGTTGVRDKTDIQLYTRFAAQAVSPSGVLTGRSVSGPVPFVECASCHDPHSAANTTFLRVVNTGSAVCRACHAK